MELSETEQRLYGELFDRLEEKNGGSGKRITGVRAGELFLASGLPQETLHRITELCGAKRLGHFGRSQFYIALKLIAAAQAGLAIAIETIGPNSGNEIPLPKFSSTAAAAAVAANKTPTGGAGNDPSSATSATSSAHFHHHHQQPAVDNPGASFSPAPSSSGAVVTPATQHLPPGAALMASSTTGGLPPPPNKGHMRSLSNQRMSHLTSQTSVGDGGAGGAAASASPATGVISTQPQLTQGGVTTGFRVGGSAPFSPAKPPMSPSAAGPTRSSAAPPVASPGIPAAMNAPSGHIITQSAPLAPPMPVPGGPPLSPHESALGGGGGAGGGGEGVAGGGGGGGAAGPAIPHHSFITDNNMNTSAKGWVPFDEDDTVSMGVDASDPRGAHAAGAPGAVDGEERSSSFDTTSLSSASDTEDVWTISDEQREYYITQFKTMQADVDGLIHGAVAKVFFEKSRLPIHELSKIWQLSDVTRDGALNLEEFCTCMHLVVLRRNEIEIPDTLPSSLLPFPPIHEEESAAAARLASLTANLTTAHRLADLDHHHQLLQHQMQQQQQQQHHASAAVGAAAVAVAAPAFHAAPAAGTASSAGVAVVADAMNAAGTLPVGSHYHQQQQQQQQQQWAHFSESPTSSILSSPGSTKPLNFDFQKPHSDESSKIAHPVALKGSQQQQQPSHNQLPAEPPPPPPRPRLHSRENSLDFNKQFMPTPLQQQQQQQQQQQAQTSVAQPQQSQQQAPGQTANNINAGPESLALGLDALSVGGGLRETEGVIRLDDGTELPRPQHLGPISREGYAQLQDLTSKIRKLKDFRQQLIMTNNEMNQELQEVMEQRIGLEIQFEHLMHRNDFL